jgi:hypothetical protein
MNETSADDWLFSRDNLNGYFEKRVVSARQAIKEWDPDELLTTPAQDVIDYIWAEHAVDLPILQRTGIEALPAEEGHIQVANGFGGQRPMAVITRRFVVPIQGDPQILLYKASTWSSNPPRGSVTRFDDSHGELYFRQQAPLGQEMTAQQIDTALHSYLDRIDACIEFARPDHQGFFSRLRDVVNSLHDRRARLLRERETEAALGYPVRRRPGASSFAVPIKRKSLRTRPIPTVRDAYQPEPVLEASDYEEVIRVLLSSRNALERSPSMTRTLNEQTIRDLLLVSLNANFEGKAGAEMFNGAGKTDILVRDGDRNVFIGECKIWHGPAATTEAIDQLLSYLVWRDSKAALLIFIRSGNPTAIATKAVQAVKDHPAHKRTLREDEPSERSDFILASLADPAREIQLALLPFVLPVAAPDDTPTGS